VVVGVVVVVLVVVGVVVVLVDVVAENKDQQLLIVRSINYHSLLDKIVKLNTASGFICSYFKIPSLSALRRGKRA
jgi:hypothetical protein